MKAQFKSGVFIFAILFAALISFRCASDQAASQQDADVINGENGDSGASNASLNGANGAKNGSNSAAGASMNNAVDGGATNNFSNANSGSENALANGTGNNAGLGASLNNAPVENLTATNTSASNLLANTGTPMNQSVTTNAAAASLNGAIAEADAKTDLASSLLDANAPAAPVAPPAAPNPSDGDHAKRAAASPFTNQHMNWPGKGKVKYANRQVTRHSSPNGPVVGEFEQGEHPLVYQNGNWAELNDGTFVKGNGLSDKGVGYNKGKAH
jgi:hypothetical protein